MSLAGTSQAAIGVKSAEFASGVDESNLTYYGWRVVLAASLGVMGGFGSLFIYTFAVFLKPLSAQFGWSREQMSAGFAVAAVTLGVVSPFLGRWLDRFSPRRIILPCVTVFGCAIASLSLLRGELWQLYVTCLVLGVVGNGAAHLAYSRSISTWFGKRLGIALAIVMVGAGLGAMLLPLFSQLVISRFGWRASYATLGALALLLGLPLTGRYVRERTQVNRATPPTVASGISWQEGLRSFAFWIIVAVLFVGSISTNGAITHLVALLTDRHISTKDAALCASLLGASSLLGRVGVGWLLDRFFGSRGAFFVSLLAASGLFLLAHANSLSAGCLAAVLIGIGVGGEAAITPYLLTRYFGLRGFSVLYGLTWTFYAAAGAIGPIILGRSFDLTGSYTSLLVALSVAMAITATTLLFLPRYPVHGTNPPSTVSQAS